MNSSVRFLSLLAILALTAVFPLPAAEPKDDGFRTYQDAAPEFVRIEVLEVRTGGTSGVMKSNQTPVEANARVIEVLRSTTGLTPGTSIQIRYNHRARGGTSAETPPILESGQVVPAFLIRKGTVYEPAALHHSFAEPTLAQLKKYEQKQRSSREALLAANDRTSRVLEAIGPRAEAPASPGAAREEKPAPLPPNTTSPAALAVTPLPTEKPEPAAPAPASAPAPAADVEALPLPQSNAVVETSPTPAPVPPPTAPAPPPAPAASAPASAPIVAAAPPAPEPAPAPPAPSSNWRNARLQRVFTTTTVSPPASAAAPEPSPTPTTAPAPKAESTPIPATPPAAAVESTVEPEAPAKAPAVVAPAPSPAKKTSSSTSPALVEGRVERMDFQTPAPTPAPASPAAAPSTAAPSPAPGSSASSAIPALRSSIEAYSGIFAIFKQGEEAELAGKKDEARILYSDARVRLEALQSADPQFEPFMVQYRLKDLQRRINGLGPAPSPEKPAPAR